MPLANLTIETPLERFDAVVGEQVANFEGNRFLRRVSNGTVSMANYHALLCTLFHQTYSGPYTFARAAVNCSWKHEAAKDYLLQHAEEERTHWRWLLNDLVATGYRGPNLQKTPPHPSSQSFIGLLYYVADEYPIARLAIASVLEGIGAAHGGTYGRRLLGALCLKPSQATFSLSHAETDKKHIVELHSAIAACELSTEDWLWMEHAARMAGRLYRDMYDHEAYR